MAGYTVFTGKREKGEGEREKERWERESGRDRETEIKRQRETV